jgi:hypothetical protein
VLRLAENRCCDSPFSGATSRPTKPRVKGEAQAAFRSARSWSVAEHGRAIYESFSVCYEACGASSPTFFDLHLLSHYLRKLDSSTLNIVQFPVGGSTRHAGYRVAPRK